jgi:hypothetical protein
MLMINVRGSNIHAEASRVLFCKLMPWTIHKADCKRSTDAIWGTEVRASGGALQACNEILRNDWMIVR